MVAMAKQKPKPKPNRKPSWMLAVRIDPELESKVAAYQDRQKFRPTLAQVVERGIQLVLDEEKKAGAE